MMYYNKVTIITYELFSVPSMGRGRGRGAGRDRGLIGQTVRISQGPYKGWCCNS